MLERLPLLLARIGISSILKRFSAGFLPSLGRRSTNRVTFWKSSAVVAPLAMSDPKEQSPTAKLLIWFAQNVFVPLVPILIAVFVDLQIGVPVHWASDETILVYTILLPVVYLETSKNALGIYFFWITSGVGIVLYTVAHAMSHLTPTQHPTATYHIALVLDCIYIAGATAWEAINTYTKNRVVG